MPPPGWPTPPAGWVPPAGWRPDPAWPDAPAGWQFWQRAPRTRADRIRLALVSVAIAFTTMMIGALVAAEIVDTAIGCGSIDPTDPANSSSVSIVNDTQADVIIDHCVGTYCHTDGLPRRLAPGGSFTDDAACGETGTEMTSWELLDQHGTLIGYIAVDSPRSTTGLVFDVSHASRNRATPTPPR